MGLRRDSPRLQFIGNLDPDTYAVLLARAPLATTRLEAIAKSGRSGETLMQTAAVVAARRAAGAFDQPAVGQDKVLAQNYLAGG